MTNYNERLDELLDNFVNGCDCRIDEGQAYLHESEFAADEAKQALTSLIKELVADEVLQARADEYNLLCSYLTRSNETAMDGPTLDLLIARGEELKRLGEER